MKRIVFMLACLFIACPFIENLLLENFVILELLCVLCIKWFPFKGFSLYHYANLFSTSISLFRLRVHCIRSLRAMRTWFHETHTKLNFMNSQDNIQSFKQKSLPCCNAFRTTQSSYFSWKELFPLKQLKTSEKIVKKKIKNKIITGKVIKQRKDTFITINAYLLASEKAIKSVA